MAFQVFLRDENHRLLAFVRRRVSSEADAHDIVQQALMQAFVALRDFRGDSLLSTWIFGIASRLVMGHYRGRPRAVLPDDGAVDALPGLEGATDPFHEVVPEGLRFTVEGQAWAYHAKALIVMISLHSAP